MTNENGPAPQKPEDPKRPPGAPSPRLSRNMVSWLVLLVLATSGCSPPPESPETRIRSLLGRAEVAAEEKDLETLTEMISEHYEAANQDKERLVRLLSYYFFRNRTIHLLTRVRGVKFQEPTRAEVTAFVAMAGQPISDLDQLTGLRADLYRFDFALMDEGRDDWKVTSAEWRRVARKDFF